MATCGRFPCATTLSTALSKGVNPVASPVKPGLTREVLVTYTLGVNKLPDVADVLTVLVHVPTYVTLGNW